MQLLSLLLALMLTLMPLAAFGQASAPTGADTSETLNGSQAAQPTEKTAEAPPEIDYAELLKHYNGIPIASIQFKGSDDVPEDVLCNALTIGEDDLFNAEQVATSHFELMDLDKFTSATIDIEESESGLVVIFELKEKWHVMSVPLMPKKRRHPAACKSKLWTEGLTELEGLTIEDIRFVGNKTTRDIVLRAELLITEGDAFSVAKMLESRQSIKNLGLFKMVWARAERGTNGAIITFSVSEKWYVLPLPTLSRNTDGDISYGGELTWENVFGLNHRAVLEIEQEDKADGDTEQTYSLDYRVPKIFGTRYGIDSGIKHQRTLTEITNDEGESSGDAYFYEDRIEIVATRWFKRISPSKGWIGGFGTRWARSYYEANSGNPELKDDFQELRFGFDGGFTAIDDFEFYRAGQEYGAGIGTGREALGSTDNFTNLTLFWRRYQPLQIPVRANLNTQLLAGYNLGRDEEFELGGADSLRGILDDDTIYGDLFAVLNVNWLIPMPRYPAFRWNVFTDIGNAWERDDINLLDLETTFGVGARWKLRSLVNLTLRLDLAFNPATGEYKFYAGTSNMF